MATYQLDKELNEIRGALDNLANKIINAQGIQGRLQSELLLTVLSQAFVDYSGILRGDGTKEEKAKARDDFNIGCKALVDEAMPVLEQDPKRVEHFNNFLSHISTAEPTTALKSRLEELKDQGQDTDQSFEPPRLK